MVIKVLEDDFKFSIRSSRSATMRAFRSKLKHKKPDPKARAHWVAAWKNFKTDTSHIVPKTKCIKRKDRRAKEKRNAYRIHYRREASQRFIPYFERKLEFAKGRAKQNVEGVLHILRAWRGEFPPVCESSDDEEYSLTEGAPPPAIVLPEPPRLRRDGFKPLEDSGEDSPSCEDESSDTSDVDSDSSGGDAWERKLIRKSQSVLSGEVLEATRNVR